MAEMTQLLAAAAGDRASAADVLPRVYDELRRLAAAKLSREAAADSVDATALVHEAYLRLVGPADVARWDHRGHFFAAAAEAMRRILVDRARARNAAKRGGDYWRIPLGEVPAPEADDELLELYEALKKLALEEPQAAELVQLRHFAGFGNADAAQLMGLAPRSADRLWAFAKAWLFREIQKLRREARSDSA